MPARATHTEPPPLARQALHLRLARHAPLPPARRRGRCRAMCREGRARGRAEGDGDGAGGGGVGRGVGGGREGGGRGCFAVDSVDAIHLPVLLYLCAVLCCAVLCCAVLCCAVLCCAVQRLESRGWLVCVREQSQPAKPGSLIDRYRVIPGFIIMSFVGK